MSLSPSNSTWKCSGASVIGNSHAANGTECQDAWAKCVYQGVLAVCVCDGAGSARFSRFGAEKTASIVSQWLAAFFKEALAKPLDVFATILDEVQKGLQQLSAELSCEKRELACTIVAAVVGDDGQWGYWHLGDGGIIAKFDDRLQVLSAPQKGDYANETYFATDADVIEHVRYAVSSEDTQNITGLAVFSDGLEMLLYHHATLAVAPAVAGMLNWHTKGDEATVSRAIETNIIEVFRQKTNDDCSLVLLTRQITDANI